MCLYITMQQKVRARQVPFHAKSKKMALAFFSMDIDIFFKSLGLSLFYIAHFLFLKS